MALEKQRKALEVKHKAQLKMLNEVSLKLQHLIHVDNFYQEIISIIQGHFSYYHLSIWTVDDLGTATLKAHDGAYESILCPGFQLKNEGIIGHVIKTGQSHCSGDVSADPNFMNLKLPVETRSELCVPVLDKDGKIVGTINVESDSYNAFDEVDLHVMETIGAQVSLALYNATLFNEVKEFNNNLQKTVEEKTHELRAAHEKIMAQQELLQKENQALKTIVSRTDGTTKKIIGESNAIKSLLSMADKIAPTRVSVLIQGESGTGKELLASRMHRMSDRADKPFVTINCGALQESLLESELFGHERGAFTGAVSQKDGLAETADGGTLFLDEIGEMSMSIQAKLLRFLQEGEIYRVGGKTPIKVNVRIISATNRDLEQEVKNSRFREDLFYRLNTITLHVPPLRKHPEDIAQLVNHFLNNSKASNTNGRSLSVEPRALEALRVYKWPGNIRELENTIERLLILTESNVIRLEDLPFNIQMAEKGSEDDATIAVKANLTNMTLEEMERNHILQMLAFQQGNKTKTAKALGITIKTLYNKLHRYGLLEKNKSEQQQPSA